MKLKSTLCLTLLAIVFASVGYGQTANGTYRSVASGNYSVATTWEKYDSVNNAWATPASKPGSATDVIVQSGHVVSMDGTGTSNSRNLTVQSGATLKSDATKQQTLRVYGTKLQNDGTIGGAGTGGADSVTLEFANAGGCLATGAGTMYVNRARSYYGQTGNVINIDQNMTFNNPGIGLTAYYGSNSTLAENTTVTINAGKRVILLDSSTLHNSSAYTKYNAGAYTYNINGILDMGHSGRTCHMIPDTFAGAILKMNISGIAILGTGFNMVNTYPSATAASNGKSEVDVLAGGVVDASATKNMNMGTNTFIMAPTAIFKRYVVGIDTTFPISTALGGNNTVIINNSGTADSFSVSVKPGVSSAWSDATKMVSRTWTINEKVGGGSSSTVKLSWMTADGGANFSATAPVFVYNNVAGAYVPTAATVTGTGTVSDPYVASVSGVSAFDQFVVGNAGLTYNDVKEIALNGKSVVIAPNPATNNAIRFQMNDIPSGSYTASVINQFGQVVFEGSIQSNGTQSSATIQLPANAPAGIYQLHISNGKLGISKKVVVQ